MSSRRRGLGFVPISVVVAMMLIGAGQGLGLPSDSGRGIGGGSMAGGDGGGVSGTEDQTFDSNGHYHRVWSEEYGLSLEVFYENNISGDPEQNPEFPKRLSNTSLNSINPQIDIEESVFAIYVVWEEQLDSTSAHLMLSGSLETGLEWIEPIEEDPGPEIVGLLPFEMVANGTYLDIIWNPVTIVQLYADLDGDMLPDVGDDFPLAFSTEGQLLEPDAISINGALDASVAVKYVNHSEVKPTIVPSSVVSESPSIIGECISILTPPDQIIDTALLKMRFEISQLPHYVREDYIVPYLYGWGEWKRLLPSKSDSDVGYSWGVTDVPGDFCLFDSSTFDSDSNGLPDAFDITETVGKGITYQGANHTSPSAYMNNNDSLHTVWIEEVNGTYSVMYRGSRDYGYSWNPSVRILSGSESNLSHLSIAGSVEHLAVVWEANVTEGNSTIPRVSLAESSDGGESWNPLAYISPTNESARNPSTDVQDDMIFVTYELIDSPVGNSTIPEGIAVVWTNHSYADIEFFVDALNQSYFGSSDTSVRNDYIFSVIGDVVRNSLVAFFADDAGENWTGPIEISSYWGDSEPESVDIALSEDRVAILTLESIAGVNQVLYQEGSLEGSGWSQKIPISNPTINSSRPQIVYSTPFFSLSWSESENGIAQIQRKAIRGIHEDILTTYPDAELPMRGTVGGNLSALAEDDGIYETITEVDHSYLKDYSKGEYTANGSSDGLFNKTFDSDDVYEHLNGQSLYHYWWIDVSEGWEHILEVEAQVADSPYSEFGFYYSLEEDEFTYMFTANWSNQGEEATDMTYWHPLPADAQDEILILIKQETSGNSFIWIDLVVVGTISDSYSLLEHAWLFNLTEGSNHTFVVQGFRSNQTGDFDSFVLSYSSDGNTYLSMMGISGQMDNGSFESHTLPKTLNGVLYVKAFDTDRNPEMPAKLASLSIDYMAVVSLSTGINEVLHETIGDTSSNSTSNYSIQIDTVSDDYQLVAGKTYSSSSQLDFFSDSSSDGFMNPAVTQTRFLLQKLSAIDPGSLAPPAPRTRNTLMNKVLSLLAVIDVGEYRFGDNELLGDLDRGIRDGVTSPSDRSEMREILNDIGDRIEPMKANPPAPYELTVTNTWAGNELRLSWKEGPGPNQLTGYNIYRTITFDHCNNGAYEMFEEDLGSVPAIQTTYLDTGLIDGYEYYYIVTSFNDHSVYESESNCDSDIPRNAAPKVSSSSPKDGDEYVNRFDTHFLFIFSEGMDTTSVEQAFTVWYDTTHLDINDCYQPVGWAGSPSYQMSCTLSHEIPMDTTVNVRISDYAKDLKGLALDGDHDGWTGGDYEFVFYTGSMDQVKPEVLYTSPEDEEVGVARTSSIQVIFSEPMDRSDTETGFDLQPSVPGSFNWNPGSTKMTFEQSSTPFDEAAEYTVTLDADFVKDAAGNTLAEDYVFEFTTDFELTAQEDSKRIILTWTDILSGTGPYDIMRADPSGDQLVGSTSEATYTIAEEVVPRTAYDFKIQATELGIEYESETLSGLMTHDLSLWLDVGEPSDQDYEWPGLSIYAAPPGVCDGWSDPLFLGGGRISYRGPPTNGDEQSCPEQVFVLNLRNYGPEMSTGFMISVGYFASSPILVEQRAEIGTWYEVGYLEGNTHLSVGSFTANPLWYLDSDLTKPDISVHFRFIGDAYVTSISAIPSSYCWGDTCAFGGISGDDPPGISKAVGTETYILKAPDPNVDYSIVMMIDEPGPGSGSIQFRQKTSPTSYVTLGSYYLYTYDRRAVFMTRHEDYYDSDSTTPVMDVELEVIAPGSFPMDTVYAMPSRTHTTFGSDLDFSRFYHTPGGAILVDPGRWTLWPGARDGPRHSKFWILSPAVAPYFDQDKTLHGYMGGDTRPSLNLWIFFDVVPSSYDISLYSKLDLGMWYWHRISPIENGALWARYFVDEDLIHVDSDGDWGMDPHASLDLIFRFESQVRIQRMDLVPDSDLDSMRDDLEIDSWHLSPFDWSTDRDMLPDNWEAQFSYLANPRNHDTDDDGLVDHGEDPDEDGLSNLYEFRYWHLDPYASTDPGVKDLFVEEDWMEITWREVDWCWDPWPRLCWKEKHFSARLTGDEKTALYGIYEDNDITLHIDDGVGDSDMGGGGPVPYHKLIRWSAGDYSVVNYYHPNYFLDENGNSRRGFHYLLMAYFNTNAPDTWTFKGSAWMPGYMFVIYWKACVNSDDRICVFQHEMGHNVIGAPGQTNVLVTNPPYRNDGHSTDSNSIMNPDNWLPTCDGELTSYDWSVTQLWRSFGSIPP